MRSLLFSCSLALIIGLLHPVPASAQTVVFNNFAGTPPPYDESAGYRVAGSTSEVGFHAHAMPFTVAPGSNMALHSIVVGFSNHPLSAGPNSFVFRLMTSSGGLPGSILESFTLTNAPVFGSAPAASTLTSSLNPVLQAGQTYFVAAFSGASNSRGVWNDAFDTVNHPLHDNGTGWLSEGVDAPASALRVLGTPVAEGPAVPEPGAALQFLPALGVVMFLKRRRS